MKFPFLRPGSTLPPARKGGGDQRAAVASAIRLHSGCERLEERIAPANVTISVSNHILTIVGDQDPNDLMLGAVDGEAATFTITVGNGESINHHGTTYTSPAGVRSIVLSLLGGDDQVITDNRPIHLLGSLIFKTGSGSNLANFANLTLGQNLVIQGDPAAIALTTNFNDMVVGGSVFINTVHGDSNTSFGAYTHTHNLIGGSINIVNGTGADDTSIIDTEVNGNVTVQNGRGNSSGIAGTTKIFNRNNNVYRTAIRGHLTVSYLTGNGDGDDGLYDAEVGGSVSFNHGAGTFTTHLDGVGVDQPVVIHGNLLFTGTGGNVVDIGLQYNKTGLEIGGNFVVLGGSSADTVKALNLIVQGATRLGLGDGDNTITLDDSSFRGAVAMTTGAGVDTLKIETMASTALPTIFFQPVLVYLGAGSDSLVQTGGDDNEQAIVSYGTFTVHHGSGVDTSTTSGKTYFPFGMSLNYGV